MTRRRSRNDATVAERLALHTVHAPSGCWVWVGSQTHGYGRIQLEGRLLYAHRVSYEVHAGAIGNGLQIDHLCRYRACINPLHLQPVTPQINVHRGTSPGARSARRDRCLRGHLNADFAVIHRGRKYCRACMQMHKRQHTEAKRAARLAAEASA